MTNIDTRSAPEWTFWATLDDEGFLCTLGELSQRRKDAEHRIAEALGETEAWPLRLIHVIVKQLGPDQALMFLHQALEVEALGGVITFFRTVFPVRQEEIRAEDGNEHFH